MRDQMVIYAIRKGNSFSCNWKRTFNAYRSEHTLFTRKLQSVENKALRIGALNPADLTISDFASKYYVDCEQFPLFWIRLYLIFFDHPTAILNLNGHYDTEPIEPIGIDHFIFLLRIH